MILGPLQHLEWRGALEFVAGVLGLASQLVEIGKDRGQRSQVSSARAT